jgi:cardiolipin synthase
MSPKYTDGNAVRLLTTGEEFFPALLAEIAAAQHEIRIETYIFQDDEIGTRVSTALIAAAARGVAVSVLVDGIGSRDYPAAKRQALEQAGVAVAVYRPDIATLAVSKNRLRRLHRKVSWFDGRIAFVGGINIVSDYAPPNDDHPQFDYAVRVEGPVLADIRVSMLRIWRVVRWSGLKRSGNAFRLTPVLPTTGDMRAAFVYRDNLRHRRDIERMYVDAINRAESTITLACAYFLPGYRFRRTLANAARRGVRVTLLLQGDTDHRFLRFATHALHAQLLAVGVRVFEYHKAVLHAKVCVVDGQWATVGSSNLDPLSLLMAREANLAIDSRAFAAKLQASLEAAIAEGALPLDAARWADRSIWMRAASWCAYQISRAALGVLGLMRDFR